MTHQDEICANAQDAHQPAADEFQAPYRYRYARSRRAHSVERLTAEYRTIARAAADDRYGALVSGCLTSAGVAADVTQALPASPACGPLMLALFDAESQGLDVQKALPRLVEGRTLVGVDDVTAVLHGRVSGWTRAAVPRGASGSAITDPAAKPIFLEASDVQRALDDRLALITPSIPSLRGGAEERGWRSLAQLSVNGLVAQL